MTAISASTQTCAILLHPASHTRSPAMHNAAFAALGIDAVYLAFDVTPERLPEAMAGARALGLRQLAISLPHKETAIEHLDAIDETARRIGAVNTVTRQGDQLLGSNTDWLGAVRALEREANLKGARAVVLGAGGTSRAVIFGLLERGAHVTVLNRSEARGQALANELGAAGSGALGDLAGLDYDVLVNTTSVGLRDAASPVPAAALRPGSVVLDAVYDPPVTTLLSDAKDRGARIIGGKWMLVHQAAEQLRLWSGWQAPVDVMAQAFDEAGS